MFIILLNVPPPLYFSEVFCGKKGDVLKENDIIKFTRLAGTYRKIAEEGPDAFYQGQLAQNLVTDIQAAGSVLSYHIVYRKAASICLSNSSSGQNTRKTVIIMWN